MKREGELKSAFGAELKRRLPAFLVLYYATNGAPDREIVGAGKTTRWEFKHGTPDFYSPGDQELMCQRLAVQSHCRYVIWQETAKGVGQRTMIVHPREVANRSGWLFVPEAYCIGFNHRWLVEQIKLAHSL